MLVMAGSLGPGIDCRLAGLCDMPGMQAVLQLHARPSQRRADPVEDQDRRQGQPQERGEDGHPLEDTANAADGRAFTVQFEFRDVGLGLSWRALPRRGRDRGIR